MGGIAAREGRVGIGGVTCRLVGSLYDSSSTVCSFSLIQASMSSASRLNCWIVLDSPSLERRSTSAAFRVAHLPDKHNCCYLQTRESGHG